MKTMNSVEYVTQWLNDKWRSVQGLSHQGRYMKSTQWQGLSFAEVCKVPFQLRPRHCGSIVALRSAGFQEKGDKVWATLALPVLLCARKLFLVGLQWQLSERGFVKRDVHIDENVLSFKLVK